MDNTKWLGDFRRCPARVMADGHFLGASLLPLGLPCALDRQADVHLSAHLFLQNRANCVHSVVTARLRGHTGRQAPCPGGTHIPVEGDRL